jgi:hypothetical protein
MSTIATEKTANYIFRPVLKTRPKKTFPYTLESVDPKKDGKFMIGGYWLSQHHMILDMMANEILEKFERVLNKGDIFKSHYDKKVIEDAEEIDYELLRYLSSQENYKKDEKGFKDKLDEVYGATLLLNEKDLIKKYIFLNGMTSNDIYKLIKETSETLVKIPYRVKVLNGKKNKFSHYTYRMWTAEKLFKVEDTILEQTNHNPPRVKLRDYKIEFGGIFGKLFAHNVRALNVIRFPIEIYSLSQDAQFIYRRFISTMVIPKGSEKSGKFQIEFDAIMKYMDIKTEHSTHNRGRITRALDELKKAELIQYKNNRVRRHDYITYEVVRLR